MKVSRTRIPSNKTTYEEGRQEIEAVEKSARFHYRVMFFHSSITRRTFFWEHSIIFFPPWYKIPRGNVPSKVSIFLNPYIHRRFHFPWLLFAYKVATHPNVTFYLKFQDVEIEEPCFRFPFSFAFLFSRFTFHPFFHGTTIDYRNPLFPYFSADTLVSFFVDGFPRIPPRALDSIRRNSYTPRMVSFISIDWMWFAYFSQLNEFYFYCISRNYIDN